MDNVLILLASFLALATIASLFSRLIWPLEYFYHFRFQYGVVFLLLTVVFFGLGRLDLMFWAFVFASINAGGVYTYFHPRIRVAESPGPKPESGRLRALTWNVLLVNDKYNRVLRYIEEVNPDFISLQELTDDWLRALEPLGERYPHSIIETKEWKYGIGFWSRLPIRNIKIDRNREARSPLLVAQLESEEGSFLMITAHPRSPLRPRGLILRDQRLEEIASISSAEPGRRVVLGDLNCTPWASAFKTLLTSGALTDSGLGYGYVGTWPAQLPGFFRLPIDHFLYSQGIKIEGRWVGPAEGSDHRPLVVDFRLSKESGY
jgi:endonuclease/exonuclease/phosphatase (EEP) superfamily protein YafD